MGKFIGAILSAIGLAVAIIFSGGTAAIIMAGVALAASVGAVLFAPKAPSCQYYTSRQMFQ